jgi:hypothetical protein
MTRPLRILAIAPVVAGLAWLAVHSFEAGAAGTQVFEAGVAMRAASVPGASRLAIDALPGVRDELLQAQTTTPRDPALHELLGLLDARQGNGPERFTSAAAHFVKALELRPTSPQTWGNLVAMKYRSGDTGAEFDAAIRHAAQLGKFEPEVQAILANYGLAMWDEIGPENRAAVETVIATGMKRNSLELLQIADRRGRLDVACRHLDGSTRQVDPKWSQLCQSMEATP